MPPERSNNNSSSNKNTFLFQFVICDAVGSDKRAARQLQKRHDKRRFPQTSTHPKQYQSNAHQQIRGRRYFVAKPKTIIRFSAFGLLWPRILMPSFPGPSYTGHEEKTACHSSVYMPRPWASRLCYCITCKTGSSKLLYPHSALMQTRQKTQSMLMAVSLHGSMCNGSLQEQWQTYVKQIRI